VAPTHPDADVGAGAETGPCRAPGRPRDERASQAITEAALRQLDQLGYAHMSMESVAVEAGVSRATVYRRYRDKGDLVTAAIAANARAGPASGATSAPREDLARYLREFDERFAESCLEVLGALVGAREDPGALTLHRERVIAPRTAYARSLLDEARRRGELRPDADIDLALEMAAGSVFYRRVAGITSGTDWATRAVDAIWAAMGPGPA